MFWVMRKIYDYEHCPVVDDVNRRPTVLLLESFAKLELFVYQWIEQRLAIVPV